ncbi:L-threonine 3-dehydrogenase [Fusibacter ferrireducens]|nr:L-threonine 3-dehydrogenase [Fusibacter ferrireducens]
MNTKMKALVKKFPKEGLWLEEVEIPVIGEKDVLVKMKKTAICGTDVHIYNWDKWSQETIPVPMTIGHEFVGEVVEVGSLVRNFKVGDLVSGEGHIVCGVCRNCLAGKRYLCKDTIGIGVNRTGIFAEYASIPETNVWMCDKSISEDALCILDPLGNAVHTALSFDLAGEDVLITGAGPIGIMAAAVAKHVGARHVVITDINDYRLKLAKELGPIITVNTKKEKLADVMKALGMTEGFDVGLEMSGNGDALNEMINNMVHGGKIAMLGIQAPDTQIDWNKIVFSGLFIKGIYGREMFETWYKMTAMLQSGLDISKVITHKMHYTKFEEGFQIMKSGQSGKVILEWD